MVLENVNIAVIWIDKKHMNDEDTLRKYLTFYKDLLKIDNVAVMMVNEMEQPVFFGSKENVELLKKGSWKKYPWKLYKLDKQKK